MPSPTLAFPVDEVKPSSPPIRPRPPVRSQRRRFRELADRLAHGIVWIGGIGTIVSILGIFVYLLVEVAPLFFGSSGTLTAQFSVKSSLSGDAAPLAVGVDEYQEVAYLVHPRSVEFFAIPSGTRMESEEEPPIPDGVNALGRASGRGHRFGLGTSDGKVIPLDVTMRPSFDNGVRSIIPSYAVGEPISADPSESSISQVAFEKGEEGTALVTLNTEGGLWITKISEPDEFSFDDEPVISRVEITNKPHALLTTLSLNRDGRILLAGTDDGQVIHWDVSDISNDDGPALIAQVSVSETKDPVTALGFLIGDRTIVVGTQSGAVSTWRLDEGSADERREPWLFSHTFSPHTGAVTRISPSERDKGFLTGDMNGQVMLHHSTSGQTLLEFEGTGPAVKALMFAPKADGSVDLDENGRLRSYAIHNAHPEITFQTLFQPVVYEGYEEPKHSWQSSSGSDDFEPKFGMIPLIFGTLKGTLYAMLLATPLAVMSAVYTAMFMPSHLRSVIKPVIEVMAALPSVVLGFLAGLWLAPLLERIFPAVVGAVVVIPLSVVLVCMVWQLVPRLIRARVGMGGELILLMGVIAATIAGCLLSNHQIESVLFASDYKRWFNEHLGLQYDQRNALVISFAMGFAVIPIIFSISEDAISNVPRHLIAGSLAMGATPWQTLTRLVLVSASPGIFSALMIGFGRAIGETMIVLMATGNTPIMDWSLFNGFRTLSANIAVEMPEAPHGGTLYRILFLSGLLLFGFTFAINTVAEVVRQRLRTKYSQF